MKMPPLSKPQPWVLPLTFVCLALGALIATLLRISTAQTENFSTARPEDQVRLLQLQVKELETENARLRNDNTKMLDDIANDRKSLSSFVKEMNSLRVRAGSTAVEGPGIVITIDDSKVAANTTLGGSDSALLTHDMDLLMLVNELRAADAEAIVINDQRVVQSSAVRCVGPVIHVNNRPVSAPFIVKAIGKPDVLMGAVNLPLGVLDQLRPLGIKVEVVKRDKIRLPAVPVLPPFNYGKVVPEDVKKTE